ncbi:MULTISPECIES: hypothetical protein [Cytobacillus]|uniref:Uncharacterized protein n=1 Tax=Cytobacillus stercorigallinarum TaxID=2762240 RepID=A0ABR8QM52_9BACI|nr:hypothetical protein [Cytobacillus stercorigallinarum]MBD7936601.1 hypothetical protein [Cytobacillus stercorigallinarum]
MDTSRFKIGDSATIARKFTEEDILSCQELTKDYSPVYQVQNEKWDEPFDQPIVPALLVEGLIHQVVSEKLPGCPCVLLQKELLFYDPVYRDEKITVKLDLLDCHSERHWLTMKVSCLNENNHEVIRGQLVVQLLGRKG